MQIIVLFFLAITFSGSVYADDELNSEVSAEIENPEKIELLSVITELPSTGWDSLKMGFSKESLPYWGLILGSTAVLYEYDEDIYADTQKNGRKWGIGNGDNTHALFEIGPWPVRFPTDAGSAMYFLGDGITHFAIAGSMIGYGYFFESNRAYNTGLQIVHGMTVSTVFSQILKRSFGRESPYVKTQEQGAWRPFPSISEYANNTPSYDAMPSGHVMTATMTFTVLIDNYPESAYWLRPLEITWVSLLGWQMVNNGVHWASDYPLGIAMGYVCGKTASQLGKKDKKQESSDDTFSWQVMPVYKNGMMLTQLIVNF